MFEAFHEASVDINPEYWLLDHEIGTINALKEVFGNQTVVQGCLVHWKRCFGRKVQELGLVEVINHNQEVAKWVRSLSVMQLGPVEKIDNVVHASLAFYTMSLSYHHHHLLGQAYSHLCDYVYVVS